MTIYLFGGSNTFRKNGWVKYLKPKIADGVINQSVGASTTLAAMFRFLSGNIPSPGDSIVWEYALNEVNHVKRGYELYTLLANIERFIIMCRERSCRVSAMIFTPKTEEISEKKNIYFEKIEYIFEYYRIKYTNVSHEYRKMLRVEALPAELYADNAHYVDSPSLSEFIAEKCLKNLQTATVPRQATQIYAPTGRIILLNDFCTKEFQNSSMDFPAQTLPIEFKVTQPGRLICVMTICPAQGESGVRLRIFNSSNEKLKLRFSTTRKKDINKSLLKAICLENIKDRDWIVSRGDTIKINPSSGKGLHYAEPLMVRNILNPTKNPMVMIAGILMEITE